MPEPTMPEPVETATAAAPAESGPSALASGSCLRSQASSPRFAARHGSRTWIDPARYGWYSGDHHIHAAGCRHYQDPTRGVRPDDMMRQILGESLNVASVLTWGPCYYHQKQFFTGRDDPLSRHIETLAFHTQRLGLQGRVTGSHLTSMHSMDNYYVSKLIPLIAEARVNAVANPLINITLQGRHDTYPKRRGMTRVPELMAAGVNVGFGHDCVMDPWYSLGSADMLEVAQMGLHVAQMTSQSQMRSCFDAVTVNNAKVLGLTDYGIEVGRPANFVLLQARDTIEAIRLRATRLAVVRNGEVIARTPAATARIELPGRSSDIDWSL